MKKKLLFLIGTRPEAVKLAPVIHAARRRPELFQIRVGVSGQHREMLDPILRYFRLNPDWDMNVMRPGQDLFDLTAAVMAGLRTALDRDRPDLMVVQGDTTTCFLGALAAFYSGVPVAHVEAGLRTGNRRLPFPEEMNRRLTDDLSDYWFCPTEMARSNLVGRGYPDDAIHVTGNTAVDALLWAMREQESDARKKEQAEYFHRRGIHLDDRLTVLVTAHRRESIGSGLENICRALDRLVRDLPDIQVVFPVHMNPRVRAPVEELLSGNDGIHLIDPLAYDRFVYLMSRCDLILTDSGGIQEEAPSLGKPVLVMREATERPEGVHAGTARLTGVSTAGIYREARALLENREERVRMGGIDNPFGDGRAGERIMEILQREI